MTYIVMAYILMACIVMAYMVMAYIFMTHIGIPSPPSAASVDGSMCSVRICQSRHFCAKSSNRPPSSSVAAETIDISF